mmetsp:Transcript_21839/g.32704  ORF Transcript_21839/g.32704 Transcript_21839/m.32704 type:complete len:302 (-) Transcript_21839:157-1062(-)
MEEHQKKRVAATAVPPIGIEQKKQRGPTASADRIKQIHNPKKEKPKLLSVINCQGLEESLRTITQINEMQTGEREILCSGDNNENKSRGGTNETEFIEVRFRKGNANDIANLAAFCHAKIMNSEEAHDTASKTAERSDDNETTEEQPSRVAEHLIPEQIEQLLLRGIGEENISAAMHILLCEVKVMPPAYLELAAAVVNSCEEPANAINVDKDIKDKANGSDMHKGIKDDEETSMDWLLGGVAILTEDWDTALKNKILQTEFFHVCDKWKPHGLKRRFLLRLSVLAIVSGCNRLVLKNGGM